MVIRKFVAAFLLGVAAICAQADVLNGRVVGVSDGDTIVVLDKSMSQHRIRLQGIDAPEKSQPFGQRSKEYLSSQVFNQEVQVEYEKRDKYGRLVGKVLVDSVDINLSVVSSGLAWHYKQYESEQSAADRLLYADAELKAREGRLGLWSDRDPQPPWLFRRATK